MIQSRAPNLTAAHQLKCVCEVVEMWRWTSQSTPGHISVEISRAARKDERGWFEEKPKRMVRAQRLISNSGVLHEPSEPGSNHDRFGSIYSTWTYLVTLSPARRTEFSCNQITWCPQFRMDLSWLFSTQLAMIVDSGGLAEDGHELDECWSVGTRLYFTVREKYFHPPRGAGTSRRMSGNRFSTVSTCIQYHRICLFPVFSGTKTAPCSHCELTVKKKNKSRCLVANRIIGFCRYGNNEASLAISHVSCGAW